MKFLTPMNLIYHGKKKKTLTDNVFTLRQWCSNNFPQAKEQLENMYQEAGITDEFDYLEPLPVISVGAVTDQMLEGDP
ncbi:Meiotic nuclear division protein 1 [Populus alba x Populus x berolinensis]|nr:Meiotic nuclear division protein 1 [Populus alba x Populus x berolinensis]